MIFNQKRKNIETSSDEKFQEVNEVKISVNKCKCPCGQDALVCQDQNHKIRHGMDRYHFIERTCVENESKCLFCDKIFCGDCSKHFLIVDRQCESPEKLCECSVVHRALRICSQAFQIVLI